MQESLPEYDIILLGAGHTNAHIIRMWRMSPLANTRLTCVSDFGFATYSGMLPGTLAGQYEPGEMEIDLVRLGAASDVKLVRAEVTGLDVQNQQLLLADRPPLHYDALSIGIGSVPTTVPDSCNLSLPIKPMQTFLDRLDARLAQLAEQIMDRPWRITIAGAGAAGIEIALCLLPRVSRSYQTPEITLVDRKADILHGMPARTIQLAKRELQARGIRLLPSSEIQRIGDSGCVELDDGSRLESDLLLWATSAASPSLLVRLGLPTDDQGFLLTRDTLQSTGSDSVFVVGDSGTCVDQPRPKAGVFAVRQGPVLWENLRRKIKGQSLLPWKPQRSFLSLLNTGDGRAILTYKGWSVHARWCWRLKDTIDRRFMAKYQDYQPAMPVLQDQLPASGQRMYCGGCGSKVDADLLTSVLRRLDSPTTSQVLVGLDQPDDVAVLQPSQGTAIAATADFFTAFIDDPYVLGRIAALNALSDLHAKGAQPLGAIALAAVPHGPRAQQEEFLFQLLDGSLRELRPAGVPLVGGHTIEAAQATIGYTILGEVTPATMATKGHLHVGDYLVLTKPLGTGILLAGHMRALCRSDWMESLMDSMLTSNQNAGEAASRLQLAAVTDVTGFGLVGHLMEMLQAANLSAELSIDAIPLLPGTQELLEQRIESTLAPGNRRSETLVESDEEIRRDVRYSALFDPQTSGGLLMAVGQQQLSLLSDRLGNSATVIGKVVPAEGGKPMVHLRR